jgi:hypothetical protein
MVGRAGNAYYRRELNFLSQSNYTGYPTGYIGIQIQAIVGFATPPYHCGDSLRTTPLTKK